MYRVIAWIAVSAVVSLGAYRWVWQRGYDAADSACNAALETARIAQLQALRASVRIATEIADAAAEQARAAIPEIQRNTASAVERVRTVTRTIEIPAECPSTLPPAVHAEGVAAVERANRY